MPNRPSPSQTASLDQATSSEESAAGASLREDGYLPIEKYAPVGDGRTVALVGSDGAIDWMCLPELDSPSLFAALLDPGRGGSFSVAPAIPFRSRREYLEQTNVLRTVFETDAGEVAVTDAVTIDDSQAAPWRELVRRIDGISGEVPMRIHCHPVLGFGAEPAQWQARDGAHVARQEDFLIALCHWDAGEPVVNGAAVVSDLVVREGTTALLALVAANAHPLPIPSRESVQRRLDRTAEVWRSWVTHHTYTGQWKEAVERSLLALRLLADGRTGAIAAAATSSLPETIGAERNFDYRFAWVRDLSFTVDAMLNAGMDETALRAIGWILDAVAHTAPRVDPVYSLTGSVVRGQQSLDLAGYRGSTPVLLGNNAGSQLQLGGAGDLIETVWLAVRRGTILPTAVGERIADIADQLCFLWRLEDAGLWELGSYAQYTTSKLSCWVTFDRVLDLVRRGQVPARHVERWERERDAVHSYIETELWSQERQSYRFKAGSDELDCGVLLAARRGYVPPGSPRLSTTVDAILEELSAGDGLVYRYSGMQKQENAFLACSFWVVEALAYVGRMDEARERMAQVVELASDVGLFSEEMEPGTHALRGNFPQALTHLGLINAAQMLDQRGS